MNAVLEPSTDSITASVSSLAAFKEWTLAQINQSRKKQRENTHFHVSSSPALLAHPTAVSSSLCQQTHTVLPSLKQPNDDSFPAMSYIITGLETDCDLPHEGSAAHRVQGPK